MKLISKSALLLLLLVILYLLITGSLLSWSPFVIAGQILAVLLSAWARRSFGAGQFSIQADPVVSSVISRGPYQFIRHPMYAAALLLIWSSLLGHYSLINVIIGLLITGVLVIRIVTEEQLLQAAYPDYHKYAGKTKRIIPFLF